jgi:alkylation response protein AidB-like acyl-CoA dehydrogenase
MDFSFSEEQSLLADSVERFIQNDYPFEARQKLVGSESGFSTDNWRTFAELGWLGIPFAEEDGGFGGSAVDVMILMEQFGKGLVVEPYLASVVLVGGILKAAASKDQKAAWLSGIVDGTKQAAFAFAEPQGRFNLADLTTRASRTGTGFQLNGYKCVVLNGPAADFLLVSARTGGGQRDLDGISLFIVSADTAGVSRRDYPTVDAFRAYLRKR